MKFQLKKLFTKSKNANQNAKKEQLKTALILSGFAIVGVGFYYYSTAKSSHHSKQVMHFSGAFDDNVGLSYDHEKVKALQASIDQTNAKIQKLEKQKSKAAQVQSDQLDQTTRKQMEAMQKQIKKLQQSLQHQQIQKQVILKKDTANHVATSTPKAITTPIQKHNQSTYQPVVSTIGIEDVNINYPETSQGKLKRNANNYVWAGTFASGYLLTGIIADAGANSTKNKGMVAIRLSSNGTMPNDRQSHLKNCLVLGSTYGDLSSDTAVVHLETLSCAGKEYSFEKKVYGSVFDVDAMQDIRGTADIKSKPILSYAMFAGLIAGIGDGLSASGHSSTVTGSGVVTTPTSVLKSGIGGGLSKSGDKLVDYLMNIANIYHPVVVVKPGRKVTIMFQAGFWIDQAHADFESMKSIDAGKKVADKTKVVDSVTSSFRIASNTNDDLSHQVAKASGKVTQMAQQQANDQFNANQLKLGQSLFSQVSQGANS